MSISRKIIFSSTIVAILAALAAFMGWRNTQPIQQHLVKKLTHTTEEIRFLDDIKANVSVINSEIQANTKAINNNNIRNLDHYFEKARLLDIRVKALQVQIQAFKEFNQTANSETEVEALFHLSEILREQTRILIPNKDILPSPVIALKAGLNTRNTVKEIEALITNINTHRFSLIRTEGELVKEQISKLNFWIILIGGLTFLMSIVFGRVIAYNLSQEIRTLRQVAKQLNKGDYSVRVGSKSNDEFGTLGQTFDGMAANLEQSKTIETQKVEMEKLNAALKIKNDSLDRFVYRVSHDLKAPIINIKSLLRLIKLKISTIESTEVKQSFFFLEKSTDKLEQTILDLLEVSRIEKSLDTVNEWVDLESIITEIKRSNSEKITNQDSTITTNLTVPKIFFPKPNMDSILSNLISNSLKYSSPQRASEIYLETKKQGNFVCLTIKDNGIGIDLKKHRAKLFKMFNRFHNHVEGSGVGLYIVKKIIDDAGGKIEIDSIVNEGTTFNLYFPHQSKDVLSNRIEEQKSQTVINN